MDNQNLAESSTLMDSGIRHLRAGSRTSDNNADVSKFDVDPILNIRTARICFTDRLPEKSSSKPEVFRLRPNSRNDMTGLCDLLTSRGMECAITSRRGNVCAVVPNGKKDEKTRAVMALRETIFICR